MIWPTEQCKRALNITTLPDTDLGLTKDWERQHRTVEGYRAVLTEICDEMEAAILEDNTQHHYEPDYGCTCLMPSSYGGSSVAGYSGGTISSTSRSSIDRVSHRLTMSPGSASPMSGECCSWAGEASDLGADVQDHDDDEGPPRAVSVPSVTSIPFAQGSRSFADVVRMNRDALLPQLARLFRVAPAKEFTPMLHQFIQENMRQRLLRSSRREVDWYLLRSEDVKLCEERFLEAMDFEDHNEAF
ncbi:hypothetical protein LTR01_009268, partial [Friedmanniomyces endolithicus]